MSLANTDVTASASASVVSDAAIPLLQNTASEPSRDDHRLPERDLGPIAEHHREHERRDRIVELLEHVADHAEPHRDRDVEQAVRHRVGAGQARSR